MHKFYIGLLAFLSFSLFTLPAYAQYGQSGFVFAKLTTILGALGVGFLLGFLVSPKGEKLRKVLGLSVLAILLLVALLDNGGLGWSATSIIAFIAFFGGIGYGLGKLLEALRRKPNTFGSAEWAKQEELEQHKLLGGIGFRLGKFFTQNTRKVNKKGEETNETYFELSNVHYPSDRHLLTVAPTRSGKGTTAIIPNLLTYEGSAFVIDPKGENALITAKRRKELGQEIFILDPWHIASDAGFETAHFNPLDWLDIDDPDITENAMILADALIVKEGSGDKFWDEEAKALLQGIILYVATDETEQDTRHLGRVRDLMLLDGDDTKELFQQMQQSDIHIVSSTGARCLQKEDKLLSNVMAALQAQTHMLDSSRLRESLSKSDFKFEDLKTKKITVYLVLPSDRLKAFGRWLRLMVQQAITVNARNIQDKPDKPILFLLDEMPALGRLAMVEQAFGLMAGFGMQLWGIVQDLSQLKRIYGDGWETFIGNSGVLQYFGSRDKMTAEYFSALCGMTTVWNISTAIANAFTSNGTTRTESETTSATQRKLVFPDELMRLKDDQQLLLVENMNPIWGNKKPWFEDDELKKLGINLHAPEPEKNTETDNQNEAEKD